MSCYKSITIALLRVWKPGHPVKLTKAVKSVLASGQDLMGIGLMSHIPDQLVLRKIQHTVKRHGQLHGSQIRSHMSSGPGQVLHQECTDLLGQFRKLLRRYFLDIVWFFNQI